jgi:signal peptidase I
MLKPNRKYMAVLPKGFRNLLRMIGRFFHSDIPKIDYRYPLLAAGLSLFLGLGQIYNHQYKKALFFFIAYIVGIIVVIATLTEPYSNWIIFIFVAYSLYTYNDGFVTAVKINGQQWTVRYTLAAYSALFFVVGLGTILGQFFFFSIFKLILISQPSLKPFLFKGDMVYVDCLTYKLRGPRRGEVIYYTPEAFQIEIPGFMESARWYVQERRTFERVMGLPGDVVERKNGDFFLNGNPMPFGLKPILPDNIPMNFRFEVPEDHYLAIFSHSPREKKLGGSGSSIGGRAPALNGPGVILHDWDKACMVRKKQIFGRAVFVLNPPTHRRFLLPP